MSMAAEAAVGAGGAALCTAARRQQRDAGVGLAWTACRAACTDCLPGSHGRESMGAGVWMRRRGWSKQLCVRLHCTGFVAQSKELCGALQGAQPDSALLIVQGEATMGDNCTRICDTFQQFLCSFSGSQPHASQRRPPAVHRRRRWRQR